MRQSDVDQGAYESFDSECPADITGDCIVDVSDLLAVIAQWGLPPEQLADINIPCIGDGAVNVSDLLAVIGAWGTCACGSGSPEAIPDSYYDCEQMCSGLSGQAWADCMQGCFKVLCQRGHTEYCDL